MTNSNDDTVKESKQADQTTLPELRAEPDQPNQVPALGSNAQIETIRGIINSTVAPVPLANTDEFVSQGFSFIPPPYSKGHYSLFYRALKGQEHVILKKMDLRKMKTDDMWQLLEEGCKIREYLCRKVDVPNVVRVCGQFLIDGEVLYIFMRNCPERSIHFRMRVVERFKNSHIRLWGNQLGSVCKFMQQKSIVHRTIRVEHLLLDDQDNLHLTGFTRAIFLLDPYIYQVNKCNRECRHRKRNHLPPECFFGSYHSPEYIDTWSYGVMLASLSTCRHPFQPLSKVNYEQQWKAFATKHGGMLNASLAAHLNRLFVLHECARLSLDELLKLEYIAKVDPLKAHKIMQSDKLSLIAKSAKIKRPKFEAIPVKTNTPRKSIKRGKPATAGSKGQKFSKAAQAPSPSKAIKRTSVQSEATKATETAKSEASPVISSLGSPKQPPSTKTLKLPIETLKPKEPTGSTSHITDDGPGKTSEFQTGLSGASFQVTVGSLGSDSSKISSEESAKSSQ